MQEWVEPDAIFEEPIGQVVMVKFPPILFTILAQFKIGYAIEVSFLSRIIKEMSLVGAVCRWK